MSRSDKYWLGLFGATWAAFLAGEGHAFYTKNAEGTLTHWGNSRINRNAFTKAAWWVSMAWVAAHMSTGRYGIPWDWAPKGPSCAG